jgi:hypothetical protein
VTVQRRNRASLSETRKQRLEALGFVWNAVDELWEQGIRSLAIYSKREGHCRVSAKQDESGFRLGMWVSNVRAKRDKLPKDRQDQLDKLGFVWDALEAAWERGFQVLKLYKDHTGDCLVPDDYVEEGFALGAWVGFQRRNRSKLTPNRRERLEALGFVWNAHILIWDKGFRHLQIYKEREGHCNVPRGHKENGYALDLWVTHQRADKDKLPEERRRKLDGLGFNWDPRDAAWENGLGYLIQYKQRFGHCDVPGDYKAADGYRLGVWVEGQRGQKQKLSEDRRTRLDKIGFVWNVAEMRWEKGLSCLRCYKEREGHCRVPAIYKEKGFSLGQWVRVQRKLHKAHMLSEERRLRLEKLGFVWQLR